MIPRPPDVDLPAGIGVRLDPRTKRLRGGRLFGGAPARIVRLTGSGRAAFEALMDRGPRTTAANRLGRQLTDANLAQPEPADAPLLDVTVVVPVRDRAAELDRCLTAIGTHHPVVVVDDGSSDPRAIAGIVRQHGARLVRREVNGGPAAARNTALAMIDTELVAFVDSDCVVPPDWIASLAGHLADPMVAAVAPRVVALPEPGRPGPPPWWSGYVQARSPLDLGDRAARVLPMSPVSYVPTAALVGRRAALGEGFDERLRYGEDVDLIWRLIDAGWSVRYEPSVQVAHGEPLEAVHLLRRRFRYGTSAAPLALRHPRSLSPLVVDPWCIATLAALVARRPRLALVAQATGAVLLARRLHRGGLPATVAAATTGAAARDTWLGVGRWVTQLALPAAAVVGSRRGRRLGMLSLLLATPLVDWRRRHPALDPARFAGAHLADEVAYGLGVWTGCIRHRTAAPLVPRIAIPRRSRRT